MTLDEFVEKLKNQFKEAYSDGFYATLENQINDILNEGEKNESN